MGKIKIAITDQHQIIRVGLASMLNENEELKVTHLAENTKDLIEIIEFSKKKPDIVIIDINLALAHKHQASKKIRKLLPNCKIIYFGDTESNNLMARFITNNAHGFILRKYSTLLLHKTIQKVFYN